MNERVNTEMRWHMLFEGDVQFVGFRYTARLLAKRFGLSGWVRNLPDGRVEAEVQGEAATLRKFLLQMKSQPQFHIAHCAITPIEPVTDEQRFSVRDSLYS
jgi:acylphosphatase